MSYVIVTEKDVIVGQPHASFSAAYDSATELFGDDARDWIELNVRIEENR